MLPVKKKSLCYLCCLAILFLLAACGQSSKEVAWLMEQAETVVEQQPDSALHYLQAVQDPDGLRRARRMDYYLLLLQAKDKAGKEVGKDTVISEVKDYFLREENFEKATLAAFYSGLVFAAKKDHPRALQAFLHAGKIAEHITDAKRKGLIQHNIGWLYYMTGTNYEEAIARLKKAAGYFQVENYYKYTIASLNLLGTCFLLQEQADSALFYQQQGLNIAVTNTDTAAWVAALQNISVTYRTIGNKQQAKVHALAAAGLNKTNGETVSTRLNFAYIHYDYAQYDSAEWYVRRILPFCSPDSVSELSIATAYLLAKIAEGKGEYREAMDYLNKYTALTDEMHKKQREQSLAGIREQYELALLEAEKQILKIQTSRNRLLTAFIIFALGIIIVLLITAYNHYKIRFTKAKEENSRLYHRQIDLLKNRVRHKTTVWDELYAILNERHGSAMDSMEKQLMEKDVTEDDFKICCFAFTGFSDKDIADCLNLSPNTVRTKKSEIRKKLMVRGKKSIKGFMMQQLKKKRTGIVTGLEKSAWNVRMYVSRIKIIRQMINRLYKK